MASIADVYVGHIASQFGPQLGNFPLMQLFAGPLFPGRRNNRGGRTSGNVENFDWAKPIVVDNLYHNYFQPATRALGVGSVRFHDLRHTFATLALSVGEHYMQVSKWLGHSSFVLTLTTYADYIREDDLAAPKLTRPVAATAQKVVPLQRKAR